ncbi:MAG: hypothetical protein JXC36_07930 [Candidatus Atribacteria bacterium]|nr:hypothetical protein [Candidatus Atribacteria bacterium]
MIEPMDFDVKDFLEETKAGSDFIEKEDLTLFDQTDKPFLLLYLIIFILGIILTFLAI